MTGVARIEVLEAPQSVELGDAPTQMGSPVIKLSLEGAGCFGQPGLGVAMRPAVRAEVAFCMIHAEGYGDVVQMQLDCGDEMAPGMWAHIVAGCTMTAADFLLWSKKIEQLAAIVRHEIESKGGG